MMSNNNYKVQSYEFGVRSWGLGLVFLSACLALRIAFMGNYLEGWDDVDFALALHDYDISHYQPHFPGYPVYIFFCWLVSWISSNDVLALTLPGSIFGALTILPLYSLAKGMFSREAAFVTALLFIVNPLCWLQAERPTSDSMGLFFLILSAQLLFLSLRYQRYSKAYFVAGGIVFALTLGIRLDYFPFIAIWVFALICICRQKGKLTAICCGIASLVFGMSLWLIPLIHHVKFTNLLGNALTFTNGHFTDWGGTVGTLPHIRLRLLAFLRCLLCNGLGFWWHDTSTINLIPSLIMIVGVLSYRKHLFQNLLANCHCEPKAKQSHYMGLLRSFHTLAMTRTCNWLSNERTIFILLYIIPYSLWALFCQNIEKPRHILPLVPMLLICLSYGLVKISPSLLNLPFIPSLRRRGKRGGYNNIFKTIIIGLLVVALGVSSFRLVIKHKRTLPLQVQVMNYITDNFDKLSTRLYCWDTKRLFDYYAPVWDTRRARNISDLKYDVNSSLVMPDTVLCTSQVEGIAHAISGMTLLKRFRMDRYVDNTCSELSLYLINMEKNEIASANKERHCEPRCKLLRGERSEAISFLSASQ